MDDSHPHLKASRQLVDSLDTEILKLLAQRMATTNAIGDYKSTHELAVYDPERWRQVLETRLAKAEELGLAKEFVAALFEAIHAETLKNQAKNKDDKKS